MGVGWLWLDLWFITEDSQRKMASRRDALLHDLAAMGATSMVPVPGRYLMDGVVREIPQPRQSREYWEEYFFHWEGDWGALRKVAKRYVKDARVAVRRPVMKLWMKSRDNWLSTSSGFLMASVPESGRRPSAKPETAVPHSP